MRQTIVAAVVAATCAAGTAGSVRAAGPSDAILSIGGVAPDLYGVSPPPERSYYRYEDLESVDGRREHRSMRPRVVQDEKPIDTAIDPTKVPDWYLADPTLRRGDIVVLAEGAMVFQGDDGHRSAADFVPVERSRLSPTEKARIAAMTGGRPNRVPTAALRRGHEVAFSR